MIDRLDVRAIVFDAVGTLMYAAPPVADVYARVGKSHGSTLSVEEVRARFARAFREHYCNKVSTVVDEQLERKCWQCVVDDVFAGQGIDRVAVLNDLWGYFGRSDSWAMYDDAVCAWRQLMDMDVVLGIASNFDDRLLSVCDGIPDLRDCRHIYSSAAVGFAKPDARFYHGIQARLDVPSHQICMIGDDLENDYQAAKEVGWKAVLIDRDGVTPQPDILSSLSQLFED